MSKFFSWDNLKTAMSYEEAKNPQLNKFLKTKFVLKIQNKMYPNHEIWGVVLHLLKEIYGFPKNYSVHAAGIIVSKEKSNF